jgi:hypothetical protein
MPFRRLFVSRWSALLWAGGVLRFAVEVAGFGSGSTAQPALTDASGAAIENADLGAIANIIGQ